MATLSIEQLKKQNALAYIKLEGEGLEQGLVSAKAGSDILGGIDRMVRRGIVQKYPQLNDVNFDIPVLVQKGSWTALIPSDIVGWIETAIGASVTAYSIKASQKMAGNDFSEIGVKDAVKKSVRTLQSTVKIAKHLKGSRKKVEGVRFKDNNQTLLIPNDKGEFIKVKKEEYDQYHAYPEQLLKDIAGSPTDKQSLSIGLVDGDEVKVESVEATDKQYFVDDSPLDGETKVLFPEMKHGDKVELIGLVTRANSQPNSMGFKYQDHVLTCAPKKGKVEQYKPQLFKKCILRGTVQRLMSDTFKDERMSPRLIIEELEIIETENPQIGML